MGGWFNAGGPPGSAGKNAVFARRRGFNRSIPGLALPGLDGCPVQKQRRLRLFFV